MSITPPPQNLSLTKLKIIDLQSVCVTCANTIHKSRIRSGVHDCIHVYVEISPIIFCPLFGSLRGPVGDQEKKSSRV